MSKSASPKDCYNILTTLQSTQTHKVGFLPVPTSYYGEDTKETINILVYYPHEITAKTTIFINGGPARASHSSYTAFLNKNPEIAKNMVFFDQRGTGCSTAYPKYNSVTKMKALQDWGARSISFDIEIIRRFVLGESKKVNILGQSYGGLVALKYASLFPESIRSLNIHGFSYMSDYSEFGNLRRYNEKVALEKFFHKFPNAKNSLVYLIENTPEDACIIEASRLNLCGAEIWDALAKHIGFTSTWELKASEINGFHKLIELGGTENAYNWYYNTYIKSEYENSQIDILSQLDQFNLDPLKMGFNSKEISNGQAVNNTTVQQIISAMDFMAESSNVDYDTWLEKRGEDDQDVLISYSRFKEKLIDEDYTLSPKEMLETYNVLKDSLDFDQVESNIRKYGFKVNIYSGKADTYVPPIIFEEMVQRLKGVSTYTILDSGHGGFHADDIVWESI